MRKNRHRSTTRRLSTWALAAALAAPVVMLICAHYSWATTSASAIILADDAATQPSDQQSYQRQVAQREFDLGEQARQDHHPDVAIAHYKAVINNAAADPATVVKAKAQMTLAEGDLAAEGNNETPPPPPAAASASANPAPAAPADPQLQAYDSALDDMNAGRLDAARTKLKQLADAGYKPPIFQRTPQELLVEVDARSAQPSTPAPAPAPVAQTPAPEVAPVAPTPAPTPAPVVQTPAPQPVQIAPAPSADDQAKFRARGLVDLARQAYAAGDKPEALRDYTQAADLDPSNQQAQDGKAQLLQETSVAAAPAAASAPPVPAADQFRNQLEVEIQDIQFRFNSAIRDTKASIASDDFATAQRRLEDARVARSMDPGVFPVEQLREMDSTIAQVDQQLKDEKASYDQRTAQATASQIEAQQRARAQQQLEERDRTVAALIHLARQDIDANNYAAALGVLDQIQVLDPKNDYASGVRQFVEDRAILQDQRKYREQFDLEYSRTLNSTEEEKIPYEDILRFPANWPDISEERDEEVKNEQSLTRAEEVATAQLDKVIPETNFDGTTTFTDAIGYFSDVTGANIFVNYKALEAAGIDRATPITLKLHSAKASAALRKVLDIVGGTTKVAYTIDADGVVNISTADDLAKNPVIKVYDVRDLLVDIPNFQLQDVSNVLQNSNSGGGQTVGGTGGAGGASSNNSSSSALTGGSGGGQTMQRTNKDLLDELQKLITDTVDRGSWTVNGGTVGNVAELQGFGQLVITQSADDQQEVEDLLDKIREKREIMVTVEARFLTVGRDFLEEVGLNLDAVFNTNQQPNSVFSTVPLHLLDNNFTAPATGLLTGAPNSIGTSATPSTVSFTYLDDFQVNFMLQAVEATQNSTLVNAPRVTVFDGGTAVIAVGTSFDYVSNLTPTVANNAVAYTAQISGGFTGVTMSVRANVSADRKYVTLRLQPTFSAPPVFTPFSIAEAGATTNTGSGTVVTSSVTATIQLISQQTTSVETLVTVPDGGTLLLGGQTIAAETQREQGLPVLSKIPFLKRLVTNQAMAKDEQVVLILVKPTILLNREQEDKAFPLLSNKPAGE